MRLTIGFAVDSVEFTAAVIDGSASLGGSESACVGLARALQARGHDVHIFTTKLGADAPPRDHAGVAWHRVADLPAWTILLDWDVFVALRMPIFLTGVDAKFRILWNQDLLLLGAMKNHTMTCAWAYDAVAYVSAYHRHQWETIVPELAPVGWTTRNGFDPALVPGSVAKDPSRVIHISRPERGLTPLLQMWPRLRAERPDATLALCRYSSMYDAQGWGKVCASYDAAVADVQREVGGIEWLGELGKPALYQAIAQAAVMWYPGVADFAETSCIAAIEAQACGTPFVGSYKGALTETVPGGVLVPGDATRDPAYHAASVRAVVAALDGCRTGAHGYRAAQAEGRAHVARYTYDAIAAEWEAFVLARFAARYAAETPAILARTRHDDDQVTARAIATELGDVATVADCDYVIAGKDQTADQYAECGGNPLDDLKTGSGRHAALVTTLEGRTRVIDVACGAGSFALALAHADPTRQVTAIDYAEANIAAGRAAAEELGVADRITWIAMPVWDYATGRPAVEWEAFAAAHAGAFDGLWCGEFIEHIADCTGLVDALETVVAPGGVAAFSCPFGPLSEFIDRETPFRRGHVHHFRPADLDAVFGQKAEYAVWAMPWRDETPVGTTVGNWFLRYQVSDVPTGARPLGRRRLLRPYASLTAGVIANDTIDLRRCLDAVWPVVDEIVIGNCGARPDALAAVVAEFPRKTRVVEIGPVAALLGGFSEARNRVLAAATGTWFCWIDTDEVLCGGADLRKYLDGPVFHGYAIKQQHLQLDAPMGTDTPIRVFRRRPDVQFYGCIHEQPQMGDCNGDIVPSLQVDDVQLAHTGYLHEGIRRDKALTRNLPLLVRDQKQFPTRELGTMLVLRDYANLALWARERAHGTLTDEVKQYQRLVIGLFEERFSDPAHRYYDLARPFYESALRDVAGAIEVEIGVTAATGGLNGTRTRPTRYWVRTPAQLDTLLAAKAAQAARSVAPVALDVAPLPPADRAQIADVEGVPV